MKCLNESCTNEFESGNKRRKFCSNRCKLIHFRKNGKKGEITKFDMKALYNEILDLAQRIGNGEKPNLPILENFKQSGVIHYEKTEPKSVTVTMKITRSAEQWYELKRECVSTEEWEQLKEQILAAENLSLKQKQFIINTP